MKSIEDQIVRLYESVEERNWNRVYWAIDLHDTVITGVYNKFNVGAKLYPDAKEVLDFLYDDPLHCTILWTSSYNDAVTDVCRQYNIKFNHYGENPECTNTSMCNFQNKFYFNVLLDDKSGFVGETDWTEIKNTLIKLNHWNI